MRLIDADALKKYGTVIAIVNGQKMKVVPISCIDNAPTVIPEDFMKPYEEGYERAKKDFERPLGEWVEIMRVGYRCSICHGFGFKTNFCPNCGAKMKGAEDEL